ncbi:NCK-interacting protein with SH3 domain-like [Styela clava]
MYKATHPYEAQQEHLLSFSVGDTLCILEKNNESWWLASNSLGKVGYIPRTYVTKEKNDSSDVVLRSVNNAIEELIASAPAGMLKPQQQALLKKLIAHKESLIANIKSRSSSTKRRAPPPPPPHEHEVKVSPEPSVSESTYSTASPNALSSLPPAVPQRNTSLTKPEVMEKESFSPAPSRHDVPQELGSELLGILKTTLNTNESKSRAALSAVLLAMKSGIPSLGSTLDEIMETIPKENVDEECDKLGLALANLQEIKDDAQQRNWAIGNDEDKIMGILNEILSELTSLDKKSSIKLLSHDQHVALHTLVDYHQMETRVSLRLVVLQIFGVICSLSRNLVSVLLATVLPLEIAMDITNHTQDTQKTCYSSLVMSMLFSTAEAIPFGHYGRLNQAFIGFLLNYIEDDIDDVEQDEQVVEMFINIILSFNLHFIVPSENIVMKSIISRGTCTTLSEKIMILVNRGDDPVLLEEHWENNETERPPPSVLKFLQDIFSQRDSATFLYTNDMNVLLDIITRNLADLSSGSKLRKEYLDLLLGILSNSNYSESRHRSVDIGSSLHRIKDEEQPESLEERQALEFDKHIIDEILSNYGHLFSSNIL